jgi:proteasome lid subunit RPN8/RPN11
VNEESIHWREVEAYLLKTATDGVWEECGLIAHDRDAFPMWGGPIWYVFSIRNEHEAPLHNYLMNTLDQVQAFDTMRNKNLKLWGAYHTHLGLGAIASPSESDREYWHYPPEFHMVIATHEEVNVWAGEGLPPVGSPVSM